MTVLSGKVTELIVLYTLTKFVLSHVCMVSYTYEDGSVFLDKKDFTKFKWSATSGFPIFLVQTIQKFN